MVRNQLAREIISRIAMIVMAAILLAGGIIMLVMQLVVAFVSIYGLFIAGGLIVAGGYLFIAAFIPSVNTTCEPDDPRFRLK